MTTHIGAQPDDIAEVVLMPGDPYRAKWAAETFLTNARCVNEGFQRANPNPHRILRWYAARSESPRHYLGGYNDFCVYPQFNDPTRAKLRPLCRFRPPAQSLPRGRKLGHNCKHSRW